MRSWNVASKVHVSFKLRIAHHNARGNIPGCLYMPHPPCVHYGRVTLKLPTRVSMLLVVPFAMAMFVAMSLEGVHIIFSILFTVHVMLSALAFNAAGGFSRIIGAYVCFFSLFTFIFGVFWKTLIGKAADTNLQSPVLDATLYVVSVGMLLITVYIMKNLDYRRFSLANKLHANDVDYTKIGLGCLILAFTIQFLDIALGAIPGGILSIINQLNIFLPLGVLMSTIGAIKNSNGRRSIDFIAGTSIVLNLILGTLAFSKQGMLEPIVCWAIGAAYMRFRLTTLNYIALIPTLYFALFMAAPLSGLRTDVTTGDYSQRVAILTNGLTHWDALKQRQAESEQFSIDHSEGSTYFGTSQGGIVERLTMIPIDDTLFTFTYNGNEDGYETVLWDFENWIPHFILPSKHTGYTGNHYVHEMGGGLSEEDDTTGISFSPVAEAYHIGGWPGVILLMPAIWIFFFIVTDLTLGDLNESPWGVLAVILLIHSAPESLLSGLIQGIAYGNLAFAFTMFFSIKLAPVLGSLFSSTPAPPPPRFIARPRSA
jgi:hypothetical protein